METAAPIASSAAWVSLLPLCLMTIPALVLTIILARRKGQNVPLYAVLGLLPFINFVALIWLASLTDLSVRSELEELKRRLDAKG